MDSTQTREHLQRRLESIKATPDSIQSIALWLSHHRGHIDTITKVWMHVFKASDDDRRLALFYLVNEVCQLTKLKEKSDLFTDAFYEHILTALSISKSSDVLLKKFARTVNIFEERHIFNSEQLVRMRAAQAEEDVKDYDLTGLPAEVEGYKNASVAALKGQKLMAHEDFSFVKHVKHRITDRKEGQKVLEEMEEYLDRARTFTKGCDEHTERTAALLVALEQAKRLFTIQFRNTTVVEDAYKSFLARITFVMRDLIDMKRTGIYPGATPPRDAPSPTPMDDPFASGVEYAIQHLKPSHLRDNVETMDMEMDDEDHDDRRNVQPIAYNITPTIPIGQYVPSGNGVSMHSQMYIPTPIPTGPSASGYRAPQQQQMRFSPPPPAPYVPSQLHYNPAVASNVYKPSPPKANHDLNRGHGNNDDSGHRPQYQHNAPSQASAPKGNVANANAIPLGSRGGGPSSHSWRHRMNTNSETGYPGGQPRKRSFNESGGSGHHRNDYEKEKDTRRYDDRRHSGGRRF